MFYLTTQEILDLLIPKIAPTICCFKCLTEQGCMNLLHEMKNIDITLDMIKNLEKQNPEIIKDIPRIDVDSSIFSMLPFDDIKRKKEDFSGSDISYLNHNFIKNFFHQKNDYNNYLGYLQYNMPHKSIARILDAIYEFDNDMSFQLILIYFITYFLIIEDYYQDDDQKAIIEQKAFVNTILNRTAVDYSFKGPYYIRDILKFFYKPVYKDLVVQTEIDFAITTNRITDEIPKIVRKQPRLETLICAQNQQTGEKYLNYQFVKNSPTLFSLKQEQHVENFTIKKQNVIDTIKLMPLSITSPDHRVVSLSKIIIVHKYKYKLCIQQQIQLEVINTYTSNFFNLIGDG